MSVAIFLFTIIESLFIVIRLWDKKSVANKESTDPRKTNENNTSDQQTQTNKSHNSWNHRVGRHGKKKR